MYIWALQYYLWILVDGSWFDHPSVETSNHEISFSRRESNGVKKVKHTRHIQEKVAASFKPLPPF